LRLPQIIKKNGSRVDFDRDKLAASLSLALRKRPVSSAMVEAAIARIEEKLLALGEREVASEKVGEMVMRELKKLDKVAYVRFASVYRNFEDVDEFSKVVREVSRSTPPSGR
jgi:transcriptional repressor NrdR